MPKNNHTITKNDLTKPYMKTIYSFLGVLGVYYIYTTTLLNSFLLANILVIPSFIFYIYFWFRIFQLHSKPRLIYHIIFSVFLSTIFIIGGELNNFSQIIWSLSTILKITLGSFSFFPFLELLNSFIPTKKQSFVPTKKQKILAFVLPLICCLIAWILFFPGIYTYDMAAWNEQFSSGIISPHWSITYGLYLASFLDLGHLVFNNYEIGFSIAMLIQLIFMSYVLYRIIIFATYESKNRFIYYGSIFFFCLNVFIITMSVTDAQDVAFSCLFSLFIIELLTAIKNPKYHNKKIKIFYLFILAFLLTTIRNNGIICLGFCLIPLLFIKTFNRKTIIVALSCAVLANIIYTGPIYQIIGVKENSTAIKEVLSVPSQQLARSYYENPTSFAEEDLENLNKFYKIDNRSSFKNYQAYPLIADYTKGSLNSDYTKNHLLDYIILWTKISLKNPDNYIEAFLLNSFGFWYPIKNYDDPRLNPEYMNYPGFSMTAAYEDTEKHPNMKKVQRLMPSNPLTDNLHSAIFENNWYHIPIIAQISSIGLYTIIFLYMIGSLIIKKSYYQLIAISPAIGLLITILVAPVAIFRYALPLALLMPVVAYLLIAKEKH